MSNLHQFYIQEAVRLAAENASSGQGGPFGALVVLNGEIIGRGVNRVTGIHDPTAHAEVMAIRDACRNLNTFKLEGAVIYASCEPCPMCLSAIYWARLKTIYYAAQNTDAAKAGFDDSFIYEQVPLAPEEREIPGIQLEIDTFFEPFRIWIASEEKTDY
jgi:guanine deaminase